MRTASPLPVLLAAALLAACGGDDGPPASGAEADGPPVVATTFEPTTYFARRIAGDLARVVCPLPPGADPITWIPGDEALARYREADRILLNGAGLERWVDKVTLPEARVVVTAASFRDEWLRYEHATTHRHGRAGEHAHEGLDGHTWLDPALAERQARAVLDALVALRPDARDVLAGRFEALAADLRALDGDLRALVPPEGTWLYASHPAYNYLARRCDWPLVNLDLDPDGAPPAEAALGALAARLRERPGRFLLWESAPNPALAARLDEALGLRSIVVSPGETPDDAGRDWLAVQRANVAALRPAFESP